MSADTEEIKGDEQWCLVQQLQGRVAISPPAHASGL